MLKLGDTINMDVTDNADWRYERLHVVLGYLYAQDEFVTDVITDIKDEKGTLIINWITEPPSSLIKNCQEIWSSKLCRYEPYNKIEHYVNGHILKEKINALENK